ncbi:TniB family NTP-binding protein [Gimibacter soli]|uniref:TniB family NTP-binding protein n=1 Tax=Gimibacter soli TaxID=3024400 RepID=A0AAE9XUD1_9PROT|nr:TniB family NTP-binding protein [Gimibacter soli]WCL52884.1 TniB family NTP-binding protein [Gimibacter soli]
MTSDDDFLKRPAEVRIDALWRDHWIDLPMIMPICKAILDCALMPRRSRPRWILVAADPNMGKSRLLDHVGREINRGVGQISGPHDQRPALVYEMPNAPTADGFLRGLLVAAGLGHTGMRDEILFHFCLNRLGNMGAKVILINEFQGLINTPTKADFATIVRNLQRLSEGLQASIVAFGSQKTLLPMIQGEEQLYHRFDIFELRQWKLDDSFRQFVATILATLPLREGVDPALAREKVLLQEILDQGKASTGGVIDYLRDLATAAIRNRTEHLGRDAILGTQADPDDER